MTAGPYVSIRIKVRPGPSGSFVASLAGEELLTSRQPMADSARVLLGRGFNPDILATMRHEGKNFDSFDFMELRKWAMLTYPERDKSSLKSERWMPFAGPRSGRVGDS